MVFPRLLAENWPFLKGLMNSLKNSEIFLVLRNPTYLQGREDLQACAIFSSVLDDPG